MVALGRGREDEEIGGGGGDSSEARASFSGDGNLLKFIVMIFAQLYDYTKSHWILYFNWVNCMVCGLYLNEAFF